MQYKTFIWPHNPASLEVVDARQIRQFPLPYAAAAYQDLGLSGRLVRGSGALFGSQAENQRQSLEALLRQGGAGTLLLPGGESFQALFCAFSARRDSVPGLLQYTFEFREVV